MRFGTDGVDAYRLAEELLDREVAVLPGGPAAMRVIPHLHTTDGDVADALEVFRRTAA